jgi:hypothetical protein
MLKRLLFLLLALTPFISAQNWPAPVINRLDDCYQFTCGFSPASHVTQEDDSIWQVSAEAVLGKPSYRPDGRPTFYEINFQLPPNGTILAFEGVVALRSSACSAQAAGYIEVDGKRYAPSIIKSAWDDSMANQTNNRNGRVMPTSIFLSYRIPMKYTNGNAKLHVEADPECYDPHHPSTWEIQGMLLVSAQ